MLVFYEGQWLIIGWKKKTSEFETIKETANVHCLEIIQSLKLPHLYDNIVIIIKNVGTLWLKKKVDEEVWNTKAQGLFWRALQNY